jgi:prophage regulatory protein
VRLITFRELRLQKGYPYSRRHTERLVKAGLFPAPVHLGGRRVAWIEDEVDDWIAERAAERKPLDVARNDTAPAAMAAASPRT